MMLQKITKTKTIPLSSDHRIYSYSALSVSFEFLHPETESTYHITATKSDLLSLLSYIENAENAVKAKLDGNNEVF